MLTIRTAHSGHRQDEDDRRYTPRAGASHAAPAHRPNSDTESWASSSTGSYSSHGSESDWSASASAAGTPRNCDHRYSAPPSNCEPAERYGHAAEHGVHCGHYDHRQAAAADKAGYYDRPVAEPAAPYYESDTPCYGGAEPYSEYPVGEHRECWLDPVGEPHAAGAHGAYGAGQAEYQAVYQAEYRAEYQAEYQNDDAYYGGGAPTPAHAYPPADPYATGGGGGGYDTPAHSAAEIAFMEQRLLRAVAANEVAEAAGLLQQGASVHCVNAHGDSPLAVACRTGCKRLVKVALRYGANINLQNHVNGNTPLHESHCGGHAATIGTYLCSKGADCTLRNAKGATCYEARRR
jgi:hypothetical protein